MVLDNLKTKIKSKCRLIREWLLFLPENFEKIYLIYQQPNGNTVLFIDKFICLIEFPLLCLVTCKWLSKNISNIIWKEKYQNQ